MTLVQFHNQCNAVVGVGVGTCPGCTLSRLSYRCLADSGRGCKHHNLCLLQLTKMLYQRHSRCILVVLEAVDVFLECNLNKPLYRCLVDSGLGCKHHKLCLLRLTKMLYQRRSRCILVVLVAVDVFPVYNSNRPLYRCLVDVYLWHRLYNCLFRQ